MRKKKAWECWEELTVTLFYSANSETQKCAHKWDLTLTTLLSNFNFIYYAMWRAKFGYCENLVAINNRDLLNWKTQKQYMILGICLTYVSFWIFWFNCNETISTKFLFLHLSFPFIESTISMANWIPSIMQEIV